MYDDELDPIDLFFHYVVDFVESYTNFCSYQAMTDEKKAKYVELLTLKIIYATSPRKNYDISKETIRLVVRDILDRHLAEVPDNGS